MFICFLGCSAPFSLHARRLNVPGALPMLFNGGGEMKEEEKKVGRYDALCGPSDVLFLAVSLKRWLVGVLLQLEELCARQHPNVNPERLFLIANGGISFKGFNFFCSISETLLSSPPLFESPCLATRVYTLD